MALDALRALSRVEAPRLDSITLRELEESGCVARYTRDEHLALRQEAARLPAVRSQLSIAASRAREIGSWARKVGAIGRAVEGCFGSSGTAAQGDPAALRRLMDESRERQELECRRLERLASNLAGAVECEHGYLVVTERGQRVLTLLEPAAERLRGLDLNRFLSERRDREDRIGDCLTRFLSAFSALGADGNDSSCIEGAIALSVPGRSIADNIGRFGATAAAIRAAGAGADAARIIALSSFDWPEARVSDLAFVASKLTCKSADDRWCLGRELMDVPGRTVADRLAIAVEISGAFFGEMAPDGARKDPLLLAPAARAASLGMPPAVIGALYSDLARDLALEIGCPSLSRGLRLEGARRERAAASWCVVELAAGCRPPNACPPGELSGRFARALECLERHGLSRKDETAPLIAARIARLPGAVSEHVEDLERIYQRLYDMDVYLTMMTEISLGVLEHALGGRRSLPAWFLSGMR